MKIMPEKPTSKAYPIKEAAKIAGRSITWLRQQRRFGSLVPTEINGLQAVTAESLHALVTRGRAAREPMIRLVIDNTK
jgi:hypothetical protein